MSSAALVALCLIALLAFGIYVVRNGGRFRFRAEALGVSAEGEIETGHRAGALPARVPRK